MHAWLAALLQNLGMGGSAASESTPNLPLVTAAEPYPYPSSAMYPRSRPVVSADVLALVGFVAPDTAANPEPWKTQSAGGRYSGGQSVTGRPPNP